MYLLTGPFRLGWEAGWREEVSPSLLEICCIWFPWMDDMVFSEDFLDSVVLSSRGTGKRQAFGRKQCLEDQTTSIEQAEADTALASPSRTHHLPAACPSVCPEKSAAPRSHCTWWTFTLARNSDKILFSKAPKSVFHSLLILIMYWVDAGELWGTGWFV